MTLALLSLAHSTSFNDTAKAALEEESGWEDVGTMEREGIAVQGRHKVIEGVDCLEASAVTTHDPEVMKAIILDIRANTDWSSADLKVSDVLKESSTEIDYVQVLEVPAPFADRYWFLRGVIAETEAMWQFSWAWIDGKTEYPDVYSKVVGEDLVEVDVNVGSWALLPVEGAGTQARFRSCTNVGGSIPKWAGEQAAKLMLPNNIEDLFSEAQKRSATP